MTEKAPLTDEQLQELVGAELSRRAGESFDAAYIEWLASLTDDERRAVADEEPSS